VEETKINKPAKTGFFFVRQIERRRRPTPSKFQAKKSPLKAGLNPFLEEKWRRQVHCARKMLQRNKRFVAKCNLPPNVPASQRKTTLTHRNIGEQTACGIDARLSNEETLIVDESA